MDSVLRVMLTLMLGFRLLVSIAVIVFFSCGFFAWLLFRPGPVTESAGTQYL